ncbi:MAG: cytochrome ubiquinol oxidase subunit I, partial [Planctomycetota bacterium]|nr:cytochrome ubiquinol oxidase subunit I [Planctomycetota bacterium]
MNRKRLFKTLLVLAAILWVGLALAPPLLAADEPSEDYRPFFFGIENRTVVWIIAQLHLMFGAFVLGVPLFASIVELIGMMTGDPRYDRLSHEFTRLLSAAFSTTAALGGALAFALIGLYPAFMNHLSGAFHKTYYIYAGFFFVEAFALYSYYYSWNRLQGKKPGFGLAGIFNLFLTGALFAAVGYLLGGFASTVIESIPRWAGSTSGIPGGLDHSLKIGVAGAAVILFIWKWSKAALENRKWLHFNLGIVVNLAGITLMFIANSWATYMMSPPHVSAAAGMDPDYWSEGGRFLGTAWEAVNNALWMPVNIHRLIANVAFGGFVVSAYAAIKYLGAKRFADRAHYDWMGYIGSFVGMAALLPLPFAGYYLGRELYSYSNTMGQDMMGGTFSWTFIIQAILIAMLFIGINFYLWSGLGRIRGSEKYSLHILVMLTLLVICFGIWSTPHNLPMSAEERNLVGSQFHPSLARFGLMSAKNAVVYFIIVTTFFSFLIYRRANKGKLVPFREHGKPAIITLGILGAFCTWLLLNQAFHVWHLDLGPYNVDGEEIIQVLGMDMSIRGFLDLSGWFLVVHICALWAGIVLALKN